MRKNCIKEDEWSPDYNVYNIGVKNILNVWYKCT